MLGDEPDEKDFDQWLGYMAMGPLSGWFLTGSVISSAVETMASGRKSFYGNEFIPASSALGDVQSAAMVLVNLAEQDEEGVKKELDRILKSNAPIYRDVKKAAENYFGDD